MYPKMPTKATYWSPYLCLVVSTSESWSIWTTLAHFAPHEKCILVEVICTLEILPIIEHNFMAMWVNTWTLYPCSTKTREVLGNLLGVRDGFPNTSHVLVEHGYNPHLFMLTRPPFSLFHQPAASSHIVLCATRPLLHRPSAWVIWGWEADAGPNFLAPPQPLSIPTMHEAVRRTQVEAGIFDKTGSPFILKFIIWTQIHVIF